MFEFRTDVATLRPIERRADGSIVADAFITKAGVFEYPDAKYPGGIRRELRPDSEVYSRATMDSFANVVCTPTHPPKLLDATNAKKWMVGSTGDTVTRTPVANDADWLVARVMVTDAPTIKRMDAGENATSCGYACWIDPVSGVDPKYGRFDVIQRGIFGNHVAVACASGRAGRTARVRMDSEITPQERAAAMQQAKRRDDIATYDQLANWQAPVEIEIPTLVVMTTSVQGHVHTLYPGDESGCTSSAQIEGDPDTHRHEWIRAVDGSMTIGENAGHTHEVDPATLGVRGDSAGNQASGGGPRGGRFDSSTIGEPTMDEIEKLKQTNKALELGLKASEAEVTSLKTRLDAAESKAGEAQGALVTIQQERDALQVRLDSGAVATETEALTRAVERADQAEAKVARFDDEVEARVDARADLQHKAASVMGVEFKMRGLSDRQIMATVVKRLDSAADVSDSVEPAYLKGRFDTLLTGRLARARQDANIGSILAPSTQHVAARADAKDKKREDYRNQGLRPLSEVLGNRKGA